MQVTPRTIGAAFLSPLALVVVASAPAIGNMAHFQWALVTAAICFPLFWACAAISHVVLRLGKWSRLREYLTVMFGVATLVLLIARIAILQWIFGNGGSEFHRGTQVIERGRFTVQGLFLLTGESMFGALWLSAAFALFWLIAVRNQGRQDA